MKTIAYFFSRILITLCFIVTGCSQNGQFTLLDGQTHTLDDFSGQWVVINFWAEWCAPCLEEVPALNQLSSAGNELNVKVIGVSYDPLSLEQLRHVVTKWKIGYPVIATEPVPILPFDLPPTLPTNYLLNPDGEVVKTLVGKQDYESLSYAIHLAKKPIKN
ncbi:TlpA family protein disulfide reductase [Aliikangiella sp. IMCC44359]|uniref:TlpA family protein disulfide reductase n=1 Tax=Aliikangiella sp. IMCC44359 TaxID=3459125 RepID=UPI00403AB2A7